MPVTISTLSDLLQWFLIGYLLTRTVKKPRAPKAEYVRVRPEYHQ